MWHDPELAEERLEWSRRGGHGKSNAERAGKRLPKDLRAVRETLLRAMAAVEAGELEPSRAQAMSGLARALIALQAETDTEQRLAALERAAGITAKRMA